MEGNKIDIEKHDLNRIQSKVKVPKLYLLDSIQTRKSKSHSQNKNSFYLSRTRLSNSIILSFVWFLEWTHTGGQMTELQGGSSSREWHKSPANYAWGP